MREEILLERSTLSSGSVAFNLDGSDEFLVRGIVRDGADIATTNVVFDSSLDGGVPLSSGPTLHVGILFDPEHNDSGISTDTSARSDLVSEYFSVASNAALQATAGITITGTASDLDGVTIQLLSSDGTTKIYRFDDDDVDGGTGYEHTDGVVVVQINGLTSATRIGEQLKNAIVGSTGHNGKLLVSGTSTLALTQKVAGYAGNTTITHLVVSGATLSSSFIGGADAGAAIWEMTFTDKPVETSSITLTDFGGTTRTFEVDNEGGGVTPGNIALNGIAAAGGGSGGMAIDFAAKVNAEAALDIIAINPSDDEILLTQGTIGTGGNTSVTVNDAAAWSAATNGVLSAFKTGSAGTASDTATAIAAAINDASTGSSLVTAATSFETEDDGTILVALILTSKLAGEYGNRILFDISDSKESTIIDTKLSGGTATLPEDGSTATATFNVYSQLTSLETDIGTSIVGNRQAETDVMLSFFGTKNYGKITFSWSGLASGDDVTLYLKLG